MTPWDGNWTSELVRDLCGGVTRTTGEIRVSVFCRGQRKAVKRLKYDEYQFDGLKMSACDLAEKLNEQLAVPINDDGSKWKIRPPEGACEKCLGRGFHKCPECDGTLETECFECGNLKNCDVCNNGVVECECKE